MTAGTIGLIVLLLFFILLLLKVPIGISLSLSAIIALSVAGVAPNMFADIVEAAVSATSLLPIPFFIIAGFVMDRSGISKRIVHFVDLVIGPITGGVAIVSVVVLMFWGAISGSGPATVAALCPVLVPLMCNAGYDKAFAAGLVAAGSGIAIIIPPSITFVVYGVVAPGASIGKLFAAGILPGILLGLCFCIYVYIYSKRHHIRGNRRGTPKEILKAFLDCLPGLFSPIIILGGIYGGVFTAVEAAAVAAIYSLLLGVLLYKEIDLKGLFHIMAQSGVSAASILLITAGAAVMAWLFTYTGVAKVVTDLLLGISTEPIVILSIIFIILLIAGLFLDGVSIVYLFVPLLLPAVQELGYETTWFGVVMIVAIAIGMITPPVAPNIYPAAQIAEVPFHAIAKNILGFVVAAIVAGVLILFIPPISLFLPQFMGL